METSQRLSDIPRAVSKLPWNFGSRVDRMDAKNGENGETAEAGRKILEDLSTDKRTTEEEFQNFMHRVTEVDKIVKKLASTDPDDQRLGKILADEILEKSIVSEVSDNVELRTKTDRTVINKSVIETDPEKMSQEAFMRGVEKDARARAENRKIRNERAETLRRIGDGAFKLSDFEKAATYYGKALDQRKDSAVLWNNRALAFIRLGLYERALLDLEWALKVNEGSLKALLNSARCYRMLGDREKCQEFVRLARTRNPRWGKMIDEFEENMNEGHPPGWCDT